MTSCSPYITKSHFYHHHYRAWWCLSRPTVRPSVLRNLRLRPPCCALQDAAVQSNASCSHGRLLPHKAALWNPVQKWSPSHAVSEHGETNRAGFQTTTDETHSRGHKGIQDGGRTIRFIILTKQRGAGGLINGAFMSGSRRKQTVSVCSLKVERTLKVNSKLFCLLKEQLLQKTTCWLCKQPQYLLNKACVIIIQYDHEIHSTQHSLCFSHWASLWCCQRFLLLSSRLDNPPGRKRFASSVWTQHLELQHTQTNTHLQCSSKNSFYFSCIRWSFIDE